MAAPNKLHFNRALEIGIGIMSSKSSQSGKVFTLRVRPSHRIKGSPGDFATLSGKNEQDLDSPNIYTSEFVKNEPGDTLVVTFEGFILNNVLKPHTPDSDAENELIKFIDIFQQKNGFRYHAKKIIENLLNFRYLRRNNVTFQYQRKLCFKTHTFEHHFILPDWIELPAIDDIKSDTSEAFEECIKFIESRLWKSDVDRWFQVSAEMYTGRGVNIFPSQLMDSDLDSKNKSDTKKIRKGRTFEKTEDETSGKRNIPVIDERHILHAIYTYDTCYKNENDLPPININPAGFCEEKGLHYRDYKKGNCLYNYQEKLLALTNELEKLSDKDSIPFHIHYLVANYLKGGVFGEKSE